ncbi:MAG TPA: DUF3568 family protein [Syntrophales bacterium]|nr:DUF3568 family protein [Syntrophales bacterium]
MVKRIYCLLFVMGIFFISGCAVLGLGAAAVGAGSGTYFYINGEGKTDYYYPFDRVWSACEKTVADMHGLDVEPSKGIGTGTISALINDEKVQFTVSYKDRNVTTVATRVGIMGNKLSSQLLNDRISDNLKN